MNDTRMKVMVNDRWPLWLPPHRAELSMTLLGIDHEEHWQGKPFPR